MSNTKIEILDNGDTDKKIDPRQRDDFGRFLPAPKKKGFVPKKYSLKIAHKLCDEISKGRSLSNICSDPESKKWDCPTLITVRKWYRKVDDFAKMYDMAQQDKADHFVDELERIMYQVEIGELDVTKAKFMADQIKWMAGKLRPRFYGERKLAIEDRDTMQVQFNFTVSEKQKTKQIEADVRDISFSEQENEEE